MASPEIQMPERYRVILDRFVAACQADERIVAATLYGSYARGAADEHSDLDLGVITTDGAYEAFVAGREVFIRQLGEPSFLEDFGSTVTVLFILTDGTECELSIGRESSFNHIHGEEYRVLLDKKNILSGATFPRQRPEPAEQVEKLGRLIYGFWHDLSHFTTAMARGQLWWAYGQLELLRRMVVDLAYLRHNFLEGGEGYDKIELYLPVAQLAPLQSTFCPMEPGPMLQAGLTILHFFQEIALPLAEEYGIKYPADLDRAMSARLEELP